MNNPQVMFVKRFLATLFRESVKTIPINDDKFNHGVQCMSDYFHEHSMEFGPYADKLDMLFLKYSINGEYRNFSQVIENFNGRLLSLENPHYVKANLKFRDDYDQELISDDRLKIKQENFNNLALCFCKGAGIEK